MSINIFNNTGQGMEFIRSAVEKYFHFLQISSSAIPVPGGPELSKKMLDYAETNMDNVFDFAERLISAKDLPDALKMQTEFIQSQAQAVTEQLKDIGAAAMKTMPAAPVMGQFSAPLGRSERMS